MGNKVHRFKGAKNVGTKNSYGSNTNSRSGYRHLPRSVALSFFSIIPMVSFYPKTLRAIGKLQNSGTLKICDPCFNSISKIIQVIMRPMVFNERYDEMKFKPIDNGNEFTIELWNNNKLQGTNRTDYNFSDIRRVLDSEVRKRLAIVILILACLLLWLGIK